MALARMVSAVHDAVAADGRVLNAYRQPLAQLRFRCRLRELELRQGGYYVPRKEVRQ